MLPTIQHREKRWNSTWQYLNVVLKHYCSLIFIYLIGLQATVGSSDENRREEEKLAV